MEKYNAETMAIVPRKPTENMVENGDTQDVINLEDSYCLMVDSAPQVEPVVPLSEVLELLGKYDLAVEDIEEWAAYAADFFKEKWDLAGCLTEHKQTIDKLKHKYGVSE